MRLSLCKLNLMSTVMIMETTRSRVVMMLTVPVLPAIPICLFGKIMIEKGKWSSILSDWNGKNSDNEPILDTFLAKLSHKVDELKEVSRKESFSNEYLTGWNFFVSFAMGHRFPENWTKKEIWMQIISVAAVLPVCDKCEIDWMNWVSSYCCY